MKKAIKASPFVAACGALLLAYSFLYLKGDESWGQSPALFCVVCGGALLVLSMVVRNKKAVPVKFEKLEKHKLLVLVAATIGYCALLGRVHFVIITAVFLFILSCLMEKKGITDSVIYAIFISFLVYFVFSMGFGIGL
ncbi:MAG: tripartite tricarboxylate transporter TctB family protein [Oscillospiraceae bacterium]